MSLNFFTFEIKREIKKFFVLLLKKDKYNVKHANVIQYCDKIYLKYVGK